MNLYALVLLFCTQAPIEEIYHPAPGDIILSTNPDKELQAQYRKLGAGPPTHSSLVTFVYTEDGGDPLVMLESVMGPGVVAVDFVELEDPTRSDILVRTLKQPLTSRETARLAEWSTRQIGKPYPSTTKVYISAIRGRPVRLLHLSPRIHDRTWFCSGLVAAGLIVEGRVNGAHVRPELVMPIDFVRDHELDLSREYWTPRPVIVRKRRAA